MKRRTIGPSVSFFAFQDIITAVVGIFILITLILVLELTERVEAASNPTASSIEQIAQTIDRVESEAARLAIEYEQQIGYQQSSIELNAFNREAKQEEIQSQTRSLSEQLATVTEDSLQIDQRLRQLEQERSKLLNQSKTLEGTRDKINALQQQIASTEAMINRLEQTKGLIFRNQTSNGRSLCLLSLSESGIELKDAKRKQVLRFSSSVPVSELKTWLERNDVQSRHFLLLVEPSGVGAFQATRRQLLSHGCMYGFDLVAAGQQVQLSFQWEE